MGITKMWPGNKVLWWKIIVLFSFSFICHSQTALQINDNGLQVEALLGQDVTIPCVLSEKNDPRKVINLDLSTDSVRWDLTMLNGSEHKVHLFTNGVSTHYRPNSNVYEKEFKRGIASLTLHNVRKSDEGEYRCVVYVSGNKLQAVRTLEVSAKPVVTLSSKEVTITLGNEQSVICYVDKFYPESVKIRWEKHSAFAVSALDKQTCTSVPTPDGDGTFNVTSLMSVKPSSLRDDGDQYSCIVSHRSLKKDYAVNFTVTVQEPPTSSVLLSVLIPILILVVAFVILVCFIFKKRPPKISEIVGMDDLVHRKNSVLSWMVSNFRPKNIEINAYLKRGDKWEKIDSWKYPLPVHSQKYDTVDHAENGEGFGLLDQQVMQSIKPKSSNFSFNCLCSTSIYPDKRYDQDTEFIIEVKHAALKSPHIKRQRLNIQGDFFSSHIIPPKCLKHGEEVTLTCEILKCDPGPLKITWLRGEQCIYKDGKIIDTRYSYTEASDEEHEGNLLKSFSSLTFIGQFNKDHGVKYTCKVLYPAIDKCLTAHLETFVAAKPVLEQITCKHVGQQMELSCRIHSFYPQTINIEWYKEDETLPTPVSVLITGEDGLYSTTSILTYTPEMEDIGKIFKCIVDHQSLLKLETREWKLEKQGTKSIIQNSLINCS